MNRERANDNQPHKSRGAGNGKARIGWGVVLHVTILPVIVAAGFLFCISPPKDETVPRDVPSVFFCQTEGNRIDRQTDGNCAAYASAYLLRHFGEQVSGEEMVPEIGRIFGFVPAGRIVDAFAKHGYRAKACHGSIDTLKQRLTEGHPVIVFLRIPGDTHYAVVVGYDERYIYLADSLAENANASDVRYNRVMTTGEFETAWKTGTPLPDRIYIVVKAADGT